jgi:exosome complex component RRP4
MEKAKKEEKKRKLVVPGEVVTEERKKLGSHVFLQEGKIISDALGFVSESEEFVSVVPLEGGYIPHIGDLIVGVITSEKYSGYMVNINSIYECFVSKKDFRDNLKEGMVISAKIFDVDELNEAKLENVRVFYGGEILRVSPVRVPRIIGKNSSMLNVIKDGTHTNIMVGRNGLVWLNGGQKELAVEAMRLIEKESHLHNLTAKVTDYLKKASQKTVEKKEVK